MIGIPSIQQQRPHKNGALFTLYLPLQATKNRQEEVL